MPEGVKVILAEPGPFVAYCERKPAVVKFNDRELPGNLVSFQDGRLKVDLSGSAAEQGPCELEIRWQP